MFDELRCDSCGFSPTRVGSALVRSCTMLCIIATSSPKLEFSSQKPCACIRHFVFIDLMGERVIAPDEICSAIARSVAFFCWSGPYTAQSCRHDPLPCSRSAAALRPLVNRLSRSSSELHFLHA